MTMRITDIKPLKDDNKPYIEITSIVKELHYNPNYGDDRLCKCGHPYYRHFDTYEKMAVVGCKYCQCNYFIENM
jgi:hypothetical protein